MNSGLTVNVNGVEPPENSLQLVEPSKPSSHVEKFSEEKKPLLITTPAGFIRQICADLLCAQMGKKPRHCWGWIGFRVSVQSAELRRQKLTGEKEFPDLTEVFVNSGDMHSCAKSLRQAAIRA